MKKSLLTLWTATALTQATLCFADYTPSAMPQGAPPQISDQIKRLIHNQIQASPKLSTTSMTAAPAAAAIPKNLSRLRSGSSTSSTAANNFDNQHAYHNKIKQYLQTQKQ